jgi:hypothetical protein
LNLGGAARAQEDKGIEPKGARAADRQSRIRARHLNRAALRAPMKTKDSEEFHGIAKLSVGLDD